MKKIIKLLLLVMLCHQGSLWAQPSDTTFYLAIINPSVLTGITYSGDGNNVVPQFSDPGMNNIAGRYTFSTFALAFPKSRFPYMQQVYKVVVSSSQFITEITHSYPDVFPHFEMLATPTLISYTPNDWAAGWYTYPWYLDYIHAREAWDYTHGSSSVVIGVTDTWFDITNPDLGPKIARIGPNVMGSIEPQHGTQVSGRIAGATDNSVGYPSIGFNCMLDLSTNWGDDNEMLTMSNTYGRKILNASWLYGGSPDLNSYLTSAVASQSIYDEIYENGTSTCIAAGNGSGSGYAPWQYCFPASFDHVISTTNVMGENCSWSGGTGAGCDQHDITGGDTVHDYQHNTRVDICSPAIRVGGLDYNTTVPTTDDLHYYCHDCGWGTSYASPVTAGTFGLMLSENPCLTPYQLEWCMKTGAHDIYYNPSNWYLSSPPRLGAGALDAEQAVYQASTLSCNDPATQTFYISGVELNTICAPGIAVSGIKPVLTPQLQNGFGPYTYRWDPIWGNNTTLDDYTSPTPTIMTSTGGNLAYYLLTVYDGSAIQKVASRVVRIQLTTDNTYKLALRDSYLDMLDQPNTQSTVDPREWNIWLSPDIWNRKTLDGNTTPQDIEYFSSGDPNFMYVRVRNVGCADYPSTNGAQLHAYWSLASTGEHWASDWTTTMVAGVSTPQPAGGEITAAGTVVPVSIPNLAAGHTFVTGIPWHPVDPTLYAGSPTSVDACGLARLLDPSLPNNGMAAPEVSHTSSNVVNNNHIVTRNMSVINLGHAVPTAAHRIYVGNTDGTSSQIFSLQMIKDRDIQLHFSGDISAYMYVAVRLQDELFNAWQLGGSRGSYASANEQLKTVYYDPNTPLRLDGITLAPTDYFYADISFILRDGVTITSPVTEQYIHFRQLTSDENGDHVYGNVSFQINIANDSSGGTAGRQSNTTIKPKEQIGNHYNVYPNPASDVVNIFYSGSNTTPVNITITDVTGRIVLSKENVNIENNTQVTYSIAELEAGQYIITLKTANGDIKNYKITKIR